MYVHNENRITVINQHGKGGQEKTYLNYYLKIKINIILSSFRNKLGGRFGRMRNAVGPEHKLTGVRISTAFSPSPSFP